MIFKTLVIFLLLLILGFPPIELMVIFFMLFALWAILEAILYVWDRFGSELSDENLGISDKNSWPPEKVGGGSYRSGNNCYIYVV